MARSLRVPLLVAMVAGLAAGCWRQPNRPVASAFRETPLGQEACRAPAVVTSADGRHVAMVVTHHGRACLAVDGKVGPPFDEIGPVLVHLGDMGFHRCAEFSDDGKHVAYTGRRGPGWHAVIDGQVGPRFGYVRLLTGRTFSGGDRHHAYVGRRAGLEQVVVDGKRGPAYPEVLDFLFSPDGRRAAYVARTRQGMQELVVDGRPLTRANEIAYRSLAFSPDGRRFAYAVQRPAPAVVVDGRSWPLRGGVLANHLLFSPDSRHLAYVGSRPNGVWAEECRVIVDGAPGPAYGVIGRPGFAPDGQRVCYAARKGSRQVVVVGDLESPPYDEVDPFPLWEPFHGTWPGPAPAWSADGRHYVYGASRGGQAFVVQDGREGPAFREVRQPVFSPDGRTLAYWARLRNGRWAVVWRGRPGSAWEDYEGAPVFSPDSRRLAYVALARPRKEWRKAVVVVDGKPGPMIGNASALSFSADSKHFAYRATDGRQRWMVLDGKAGPTYDYVDLGGWYQPTVPFEPDGSIEYIAQRGRAVYRVYQPAP